MAYTHSAMQVRADKHLSICLDPTMDRVAALVFCPRTAVFYSQQQLAHSDPAIFAHALCWL